MIKLIATDMDGTFLNKEGTFNKCFINLFYKMQAREFDSSFNVKISNQLLNSCFFYTFLSNNLYYYIVLYCIL